MRRKVVRRRWRRRRRRKKEKKKEDEEVNIREEEEKQAGGLQVKAGLHPGQVNSSSQGHIEEVKTIHTRLAPVANLNFPMRHTWVFWTVMRESS